ncbi:MAG: transposase [Thermodesulfobacteriota bacterium]|nr:transposase [Thermodesulfobacteriota bacterium]
MKNHVHMALQVEDTPLSKLMQKLSQRYTHWFNKRHKRVGHLFQGRYKAILVDSDGYLRELIRYIHLNPVRANLVQHPAEFPFSSHGAYAGNIQPPPWLTIDFGMAQFGKTQADASAAYSHFMGQISEETLMEQLRHGTKEGRILGDDIFIENVLRQNSEAAPVNITHYTGGTGGYSGTCLPGFATGDM